MKFPIFHSPRSGGWTGKKTGNSLKGLPVFESLDDVFYAIEANGVSTGLGVNDDVLNIGSVAFYKGRYYPGFVLLPDGRIELYVGVIVVVPQLKLVDGYYEIRSSGGNISAVVSADAESSAYRFLLRGLLGHLSGGKAYFNLIQKQDSTVMNQLGPLVKALGQWYALREMSATMQSHGYQSSVSLDELRTLEDTIKLHEQFTPLSKI